MPLGQRSMWRLMAPAALLLSWRVLLAVEPAIQIDPESWSSSPGPCLLARNQGVDAIAEYRTADGTRSLRVGSWLGRDGRYLLPIPSPEQSVWLQTTDGRPVRLDQVEIADCPAGLPVEAVEALARALDGRLASYYGEPAEIAGIERAFIEALAVLDGAEFELVEAIAHYDAAAFFRSIDRLETAASYYRLAAQGFQALNDLPPLAAATNALGLLAWRQGELDRAVAHFERAWALRSDLGDAYGLASVANNLGLIQARRGALASAIDWYESALHVFQGNLDLRARVNPDVLSGLEAPAADLPAALNTLNNLALVLRQQGQVDVAERYWRNYLALEAHVPDVVALAGARMNLSQLLQARGQLDEALLMLIESLNQFQAAGARRWIAEALSELAQLYQYLGDSNTALAHARQSVAIELEDVAAASESWLQLGRLLVQQQRPEEALVALERAGTLARQATSTLRRLLAESEKIQTRFQMQPDQSLLAQQREVHHQLVDAEQPIEAAIVLGRIGEMQFLLGQAEAARETLHEAVAQHRAVGDLMSEFGTLMLLSRVLEQTDAKAADSVRIRAIELAERLRDTDLPALRRAEWFAGLHAAYQRQVIALVDAGQPARAWAVAERGRTDERISETASDDRKRAATAALLDQRAELLERLHLARFDQRAPPDGGSDDPDLMALRRELDRVETALAQRSRPVARRIDRVDLQRVQAMLPPESVLLSYFMAHDRIVLWIIDNDSLRLEILERSAGLDAEILEFRDRLRHPRQATARIHQLSARLGAHLLAPAQDALAAKTRVLIQPDGALHGMPFALLAPSPDDPAKLLLTNHTVHYLPGALTGAPERRWSASPGMLVLADPGWLRAGSDVMALPEQSLLARLLRDDRLASLPGSRREAQAIVERAHDRMPVRSRTGAQATREFILSGGMRDYRYVHLATHGLVDLQFPMLSSLLLAGESTLGPAFVRPSEIARLSLTAELVVLSGCETGLGPVLPGSGALSLAHPFLVAGAHWVMASLWKIDDHRTAVFMDRFYHYLLDESQSPAAALAAAQRWTRRQAGMNHPYFWAGFILLGNSPG